MANLRLSTGLKWRWLENYGLIYTMNYGVIEVYGGTAPASADSLPLNTPLGRVTTGGALFVPGRRTGGALVLEQSTIGVVSNAAGSVWKMTANSSGTATWFRFFANVYDPNEDDGFGAYARIDGDVGEHLFLNNTAITVGTVQTVGSFALLFGS